MITRLSRSDARCTSRLVAVSPPTVPKLPWRTLRTTAAGLATSPVHFIAHHYVRYLGDLSGGQMIGKKLSTVYGLGEAGTSFYRFEQIPDPRAYKIAYRAKLDALDLPEEQAAALVAEAQQAFRHNGDVFVELGGIFPETPEDLAPAA